MLLNVKIHVRDVENTCADFKRMISADFKKYSSKFSTYYYILAFVRL